MTAKRARTSTRQVHIDGTGYGEYDGLDGLRHLLSLGPQKKTRTRRKKVRDATRSRTYDAEHKAWISTKVDPHKAIRRAISLKAIERRLGKQRMPGIRISKKLTRHAGNANAMWNRVTFSDDNPSISIVLHELAHMYTYRLYSGVAGHGREFRYVLLTLVRYAVGKEAYESLRDSFKEAKLKYTKPREK